MNDIGFRRSYAGHAAPGSSGELQRVIVSRIILDRTFRKSLLNCAYNTIKAPALEIAIPNKTGILIFCERLERQYRILMICYLIVLIVTSFSFCFYLDSEYTLVPIAFGIFFSSVIGFVHGIISIIMLKNNANDSVVIEKENCNFDSNIRFGLSEQNVVVYSGYLPFLFAGNRIGGWAFVVDISKRSDDRRPSVLLPPDAARAIEDRIEHAIRQQLGAGGSSRRLLIVNGYDADILPGGLRTIHIDYDDFKFDAEVYAALPPEQKTGRDIVEFEPIDVCLSQDVLDSISRAWPLRARQYVWSSCIIYGGELCVSFFLRVNISGRLLNIEHERFLLDPGPAKYRPPSSKSASKTFVGKVFGAIISGPFISLISPLLILDCFTRPLRQREINKIFEEDPEIDFGALPSIRQLICGGYYQSKFQQDDLEAIVRGIEKIIIEELANFLENEGIDVTDIRNKEMTIFNSGIMINGGGVNAQNLAVGSGSVANTNINTKEQNQSLNLVKGGKNE